MEWIEVPEEGLTLRQVRAITARNQSESEAIRQRVEHILQAVHDEALKEFTAIFDGPFLDSFLVTEEEIDAAVAAVGPDFMAVLEEAAANIRTYHERQVETTWMDTFRPGVRLGAKFTPIQRVGVYVPGGTAAYPSTVLMDIIPAHVAGVPSIAVFTPPKKDGSGRLLPSLRRPRRTAPSIPIFWRRPASPARRKSTKPAEPRALPRQPLAPNPSRRSLKSSGRATPT